MGTENTYPEDVSIVPAPIDTGLALRIVMRPEENPALVYLARLRSKTSRVTMESALKVIAELLSRDTPYTEIAWHLLQYPHGVMIKTRLLARHSPRTTNKMLCALRGVIEESINLGLINDNDGSWRLRLHGIRVDNDEEPAGRALEDSEVERLVAACDTATLKGARDTAMLALLFGAGLRRREVAGIGIQDYDARKGRVKVLGKGSKPRTVQLAADSAAIVAAWLKVRGATAGPLLVSFTSQRKVKVGEDGIASGLTESGVYLVLKEIAKRAGVTGIKPHDARRTRITEMISQGTSLAFVRREAGHKSSKTTDRYDRSADEAAHAAAVNVPMLARNAGTK